LPGRADFVQFEQPSRVAARLGHPIPARGATSAATGLGKFAETRMLKWALFFLVISIVAGIFGFTGISAAAAGIAKILFFIFLAVFVILLVIGFVVGSALF
jgi:uncharacterized membrane protein YtjA (UPF0391 family)